MKVFKIIPEFRILKLTFHRKSASTDSYSFFDLISVYLKTNDHLNLKLLIFVDIQVLHVLRFDFQKFRILEILNFSPMKPFSFTCI